MSTDATPRGDTAGGGQPRVGFFTDTTVCIGCKACEVACKEWNLIPETIGELTGHSYDNTGGLGANTWRHVAFVEQRIPAIVDEAVSGAYRTADRPATDDPGEARPDLSGLGTSGLGSPGSGSPGSGSPDLGSPGLDEAVSATSGSAGAATPTVDFDIRSLRDADVSGPLAEPGDTELRWLMSSDVCKHCTTAACLDVCPTGSLFRTEFSTVVVQEDICNGCGYCVPACPYGVLDQREGDGRVWKCTLCYDRLHDGLEPACATACPTDSIVFGPLEDLREQARTRLDEVVAAGMPGAQLYGDGPSDGVDGAGSIFLLLDDPEVYGLPPDPIATTKDLGSMWRAAGAAAVALVLGVTASVLGSGRGSGS